MQLVGTEEKFLQALEDAGDKLLVVEVQSETVCETGLDEPEPSLLWKIDEEKWQAQQMVSPSGRGRTSGAAPQKR